MFVALKTPAEFGISRGIMTEISEERGLVSFEQIAPDGSLPAVRKGIRHLGTDHVAEMRSKKYSRDLALEGLVQPFVIDPERNTLLDLIELVVNHILLDCDGSQDWVCNL